MQKQFTKNCLKIVYEKIIIIIIIIISSSSSSSSKVRPFGGSLIILLKSTTGVMAPSVSQNSSTRWVLRKITNHRPVSGDGALLQCSSSTMVQRWWNHLLRIVFSKFIFDGVGGGMDSSSRKC